MNGPSLPPPAVGKTDGERVSLPKSVTRLGGAPIDRSPDGTVIDESQFASVVENCPYFVGLARTDGRFSYVNLEGRRLAGIDAQHLPAFAEVFVPDDLAFVREVILAELERSHRWSGDFRFRDRLSGLPIAVAMSVYRLQPGSAVVAVVAQDASDRLRSEKRLRALVDAGASLTHSLDGPQKFADVAGLIVHTLATTSAVHVFTPGADGQTSSACVASAHVDRLSRTGARGPDDPASALASNPLTRIVAVGPSSLVTHIDDVWIERNAATPKDAEAIRAMGLRSIMSAPMVAGGEIVGVLTCALGLEARQRAGIAFAYDVEDLFFLEELGRRAGSAIETARLYERQRRIAATLQAASLPQHLLSTEAIQLDAEYLPGNAEATIGGDWYDAIELPDGRVVLTVGDVLGNGLAAAVTMTKLRQAMQSAAMVDPTPNVMLDVADKTLHLHAPEGYATALAAIYDPHAGTTTLASAGHPGPFVRSGDGSIAESTVSGLLLGLRSGEPSDVITIPTPPGSLLVFFTDGLTEATRDIDEGHRRLREALSSPEVIGSAHPAAAIVRSVLHGEDASDDIAVLTMQVR